MNRMITSFVTLFWTLALLTSPQLGSVRMALDNDPVVKVAESAVSSVTRDGLLHFGPELSSAVGDGLAVFEDFTGRSFAGADAIRSIIR